MHRRRYLLILVLFIIGGPLVARAGELLPIPTTAAYLLAAQQPSGLFNYDFDFALGAPSGKNNIVRQAGAAYAMSEYFAYSRDKVAKKALRRTLRKFSGLSKVVNGGALLMRGDRPETAKAGATALALLTELRYYRTSGDGGFARLRRAWLGGLRALHRPGRGFRRSPGSEEESHYYNGEVWLALAYYDLTFDDRNLATQLSEIDSYMMAAYSAAPQVGFYHWGVMAAAVRLEATGQKKFADFIIAQTRNYLDELRPTMHPDANTCYALEGLIPALSVLEKQAVKDDGLVVRLATRVRAEMQKNLSFQILEGQDRLKMSDGSVLESPDLRNHAGAFLAGRYRPSTRIDMTQHCLSAMIKYDRLLGGAP